jgi:hypothetical protein
MYVYNLPLCVGVDDAVSQEPSFYMSTSLMQYSRDTTSTTPLGSHAFQNLNTVSLNNVYKRNTIFMVTTILIVFQTNRIVMT